MATKKRCINAFLIRIKGGTHFRGTKPYIITCLDNDLSTELHRTRAVEGARYVAWNEAFTIDISQYCESEEKQSKHVTFVLMDANKTGVSTIGYVQVGLQNIRSSQLEEVTEKIVDAKGTLTFSTAPVEEERWAFSEYAEQVKGYLNSMFDGKKSEGDGASTQSESVFVKGKGAAKGMAASIVGTTQSKLSSKPSGASSRLGALEETVQTKAHETREGLTQLAERVKGDGKGDDKEGEAREGKCSSGVDSGTDRLGALEEMVQTKAHEMREGLTKVVERVKGGDKGDGKGDDKEGEAGEGKCSSGVDSGVERLGALEEMVQTKAHEMRERLTKVVERVKGGDKGDGKGDSKGGDTADDKSDDEGEGEEVTRAAHAPTPRGHVHIQ
ncbi:unnamed protein product [Agarophyton chilense]